MRLRHDAPVVRASFDDPNLVSCAGLEPVMRLAESCDLPGIVAEKVCLPTSVGSNPAGKICAIVAGMVAGADSIDDLNVVRHGGMPTMFAGVCAPSTLGTFRRGFSHGHTRQLRSAGGEVRGQLVGRTPVLSGADQVTFVDVDSMLRRCYGKHKEGVSFGHTKVGGYDVRLRGYHPLIATLSTLDAAPVVAATRLRAGNAGSARGAASMVVEAIGTAKACGAGGLIVVRADSAFYARKVVWACRRHGARFSVTTRIDAKIRAACQGITEDRWVDIRYPQAVWDDDTARRAAHRRCHPHQNPTRCDHPRPRRRREPATDPRRPDHRPTPPARRRIPVHPTMRADRECRGHCCNAPGDVGVEAVVVGIRPAIAETTMRQYADLGSPPGSTRPAPPPHPRNAARPAA